MNQTLKFSFAGFAALVLTPQAFAIDAQPLNQGGFELTPTLSVDARYNDNWTEANSSERSSWITRVAPSLKGSAKRDKTELTLGLDLSKEFVEDSGAANNSDYTVSAGVHLEPSSQSRIDLNASYTDEEDIQNSEDFTDKNVGDLRFWCGRSKNSTNRRCGLSRKTPFNHQ
jgi:opacity protein-like surface antigen